VVVYPSIIRQKTNILHYLKYRYTQKNGAVSIVKTIETAPFFCVYPVYQFIYLRFKRFRMIAIIMDHKDTEGISPNDTY
jgi:hypothetical protein